MTAPKIAGMESRKEYCAATCGDRPNNSEIEIVDPDLEIPGMMASPWAIPNEWRMPRA